MTHFKDAYIWEIINKCFEGKTKNIVIKYYVKLCHHLLHQRDIPIKTKKNLTLQRRNLTTTLTVYFSGFLLLLLIWIASVPLDEMTKVGLPEVTDNKHPQEHDIQPFVCSTPPEGTDCCK